MVIADDLTAEQEFDARLNAFFSETTAQALNSQGLSIGASPDVIAAREEAQLKHVLGQLDELAETGTLRTAFYTGGGAFGFTMAELEEAGAACVRLKQQPRYVSAYDRCFTHVRELEALLDDASDRDAPKIAAELEKANAAWDVAKKRDLDEGFRELQRVDRWRSENRDAYNASRRSVRTNPNTDTRKMTSEERAKHDADQAAKRQWVNRKRRAGWTEAQIEVALSEWWAKRRAKQAACSVL